MLRHQVINAQFVKRPRVLIENSINSFVGVDRYGEPSVGFPHLADLNACLRICAIRHLGWRREIDAMAWLNRASETLHHYFCNPWFHPQPGIANPLDKSRPETVAWYRVFSTGLPLAAFLNGDSGLANVCDWLDSDLPFEFNGPTFDSTLPTVYKFLAEWIRGNEMPDLDLEIAILRDQATRRTEHLLDAAVAAKNGDHRQYTKSLKLSLQNIRLPKSPADTLKWIALPESAIVEAARQNGMKRPQLTNKQDALLMTRESLEINTDGYAK